MDVKVTETPEAFDLPEWADVLAADPRRHIFSTPQYNRLWWEEFGQDKRLIVLTFLDPEPVGLAALMCDETDAGTRVRFLGGDDLTDYLGPLVSSEDKVPSIAESMLTHLIDDPDWDYLDLKCLPVPFGFADWLCEAADRLGLDFQLDEQELSAVLPIPNSVEEYFAMLPKHHRHELRRKMRRFHREAPEAVLHRADAETVADDVEDFIRLHRGSEGLKGQFMQPERAAFFRRLAAMSLEEGWLSLDFLRTGTHSIAATFSFEYDGVFYLYNSAYDHGLKSISPGLVIVTRLIERSIGTGLSRFDFLRGRERYKFELGGQAVPLHAVQIRRA